MKSHFTLFNKSFFISISILIFLTSCNSKTTDLISGVPNDIVFDKEGRMHILFSNISNYTDSTTDVYYTSWYNNRYDTLHNLSKSNINSSQAKLFIDNYSTVHAIWIDHCITSMCPQELYHSYLRNRKWSAPLNFDGGEVNTKGNPVHYHFGNVCSNDSGEIFLFWNKKYKTYFINNQSVKPTLFKSGTFYPDAVIDNKNNLHLILVSGNERIGETETNMDLIYYNYSIEDNTWKGPDIVYHNIKNTTKQPRIFIDTEQKLHVLWLEARNHNIFSSLFCHCSSKDGLTWSDPHIINISANNISSMDVAISDNKIFAVWSELTVENEKYTQGKLYYAVYKENEWGLPTEIKIKNVKYTGNPCITADKKGVGHVLFNGRNNQSEYGHIYHYIIKN